MQSVKKAAIFLGVLLPSAAAQASCGGAFCSLNTDLGVQGTWNKPGIRLDVRGEFINQDELRSGSHKTSPSGEVDEHDEVRTLNRNLLTTLDWNISEDWGVTLRVPLVDRAHKHIHNEDDGAGAGGVEPELEKWNFSGIGDIQALGRYNFFHDDNSNAGFRFGLQLPTGSIDRKNSGGEVAERILQPGSGSVDSLIGAYYNQHMGSLGWFVQGIWQQSIHQRDDFKPGRKLSLDTGLNYSATPDLSLLLQLNMHHKSRDSGSNAEPAESGGHSVSLSPGFSYRITSGTQIYGFLQKPIYQHVNGTQLSADWSAAFGASVQF